MTPPTDTAAAIWSAIDAYGCDAALHGALGRDATTREALDRAITAHVEAEVGRALEAAPEVDLAIVRTVTAAHDHGVAAARCSRPEFGLARLEARADDAKREESALRAAIAADKARAVAAVKDGMRRVFKCRDHEVDPTRAWGCPDCLAMLRRARPTPDEARRLVDEAIWAVRDIHDRADPYRQPAVTALLRALGGRGVTAARQPCAGWHKESRWRWILPAGWVVAEVSDGRYWSVEAGERTVAQGEASTLEAAQLAAEDALLAEADKIRRAVGR